MKFLLPVPMSNNNEGQTRHWSKSANWKKLYASTLSKMRLKATPPDHPQNIVITRILGKGERLWDADSVLRGSAKQLIDSLVGAGFLVDDGPKYLKEAIGRQDDTRRKEGPAVEIEISPV